MVTETVIGKAERSQILTTCTMAHSTFGHIMLEAFTVKCHSVKQRSLNLFIFVN
jgi:hypothetical protein